MDHPCFRPVRVSKPVVMRPVRVSRPVRMCENQGGHYSGVCCNDGCTIPDQYGRPTCYDTPFDCATNN